VCFVIELLMYHIHCRIKYVSTM